MFDVRSNNKTISLIVTIQKHKKRNFLTMHESFIRRAFDGKFEV